MAARNVSGDVQSFGGESYLILEEKYPHRRQTTPTTPTRMIRLTPAVYWNHLNRGVDVISKHMKTLATSTISENPVTSIIARLLLMHVNNADICCRLFKERELSKTPHATDARFRKGYS